MSLKELQKQAHKNAKDRGFLQGSHKETLCEIHSEISEIGEAIRDSKKANLQYFEFGCEIDNFKSAYEKSIKNTVQQEVAGAIIALMSLAEELGVDLAYYLPLEMEYNRLRGKCENIK